MVFALKWPLYTRPAFEIKFRSFDRNVLLLLFFKSRLTHAIQFLGSVSEVASGTLWHDGKVGRNWCSISGIMTLFQLLVSVRPQEIATKPVLDWFPLGTTCVFLTFFTFSIFCRFFVFLTTLSKALTSRVLAECSCCLQNPRFFAKV